MGEQEKKKSLLERIPSFSLVLIMLILMIIGAALIPLISISYFPSAKQQVRSLNISFSWSGASPRVIEQEITSKVEGLVSSVNGVEGVTSVSNEGYGYVAVKLKKNASVPAVRFEIASLLKQIAGKLPDGASQPYLSEPGGGGVKTATKTLLSYQVNADLQEDQIEEYVTKNIKPHFELMEGVKGVTISGANPKYLELTYDPVVLRSYGLSSSTIAEGVNNFLGQTRIVGDVEKMEKSGEKSRITVLLSTSDLGTDIGKIPITKIDDKIIYLNSLATVNYKDKLPDSYYRINGLNTIYLNIDVDADANLISMSDEVQGKMEQIKANLIDNFYVTLTYDAAKEIKTELHKLLRRTLLSLAILLLFVWFVSRSLRYLSIIAITLLANVLISIIFYYLFDLELHVFSLAGIAVSFGLIIDTSIVMVDHYSYYRNRKVFIAILAALVTTIGSMVIIFFMPDYVKNDLADFSLIIIINLTVALFISLFFVPAIIDRYSYSSKEAKKKIKWLRKVVATSALYSKYIRFTQKRKWIYILILVLAFGIPINLLPTRIGQSQFMWSGTEKVEPKWYEELYNKTIGGNFFQSSLKKPLEYTLGGTLRLFSEGLSSRNFTERKDVPVLHISAKMPEGSTVGALNEVVMQMENFLSKYSEIKRFTTKIGRGGGTIDVEFMEEYHFTSFPIFLKNSVASKALDIGGADWAAYGVDENGFSNSLNMDRKSHRISISGYNYDRLYKFAEGVADKIKSNKRISNIDIEAGNSGNYYGDAENDVSEMYIKYDMQKVALYGYNLGQSYGVLNELLSNSELGTYRNDGVKTDISMVSSQRDKFDVWNLFNSYITVGDRQFKYSQVGEISKRKAKGSIPKKNQEYSVDVAFNFMGSYELSDRFMKTTTEEINATLPIGFRCVNTSYNWYHDTGVQYWLILLIVVIIFFMCAILFESLRQPLTIISLIPVSFIGVFLTFYFSGVTFGTGGFAALVLLSGLVVNAAIYVVNEYNNFGKQYGGKLGKVRLYVKSFNHKIIPVLLTVLSTVLGLIPFLMDGKEEQFWFAFALGTTGGLLFSIVALVFIMPILIPLKKIDTLK